MTGVPAATVAFTFAGRVVQAPAGSSVAMALWRVEAFALRASSAVGAPRGVFCNMGVCYECLVRVDGVLVRACTTPVRPGMVVEPGGRP
jgi:predicted molibdopterin-dependent oxidoreductase YjgC